MTKNLKIVPTSAISPVRRPARGMPQYLLGAALLAYLLCASRFTESLWMLLNLGVISLPAGLLMATGSALLVLGVARSLYAAWLGKYLLALAAVQLAIAAPQIGNWQYKLSQGMLATLLFGIAIAVAGVAMAWRAGNAESPRT